MKLRTIFLVAAIAMTAAATVPQIDQKLSLVSRVLPNRDSRSARVEIEMTFRNVSSTKVKILDAFDSSVKRRSFFLITLTDSNGEVFGPYGGGNISLPAKDFKYMGINNDEEMKVVLDLREFIPKARSLASGQYRAQIEYINRYGTNCFMGSLDGGSVEVFLE